MLCFLLRTLDFDDEAISEAAKRVIICVLIVQI